MLSRSRRGLTSSASLFTLMTATAGLVVVLLLSLPSHHLASADLAPRGGGPYLARPSTRNDTGNYDFNWNGRFDAGGKGVVRNNTPGRTWPSRDTTATAVRYGFCGSVPGSQPNFLTPQAVTAQLEPGQVLNMSFVTDVDTPPGHIVFSICDKASNLTQECFNTHVLLRVEDNNLLDVSWDGRFFVKPGADVYHPAFNLPDTLTCSQCVLQWHFVAADECLPPGYSSFSFPGAFNINKTKPQCGSSSDLSVYPKEFWGCADISILPASKPSGLPCTEDDRSGCKVMLGYYAAWAYHRKAPHDFDIEDIDASKYTHLVYAHAAIDSSFHVTPGQPEDADGTRYSRFQEHVRSRNPAIKTLLSIGGYGFNTGTMTKYRFSTMMADSQRRGTFIASLIPFLRQHGFDGVDVDWQFPGSAQNGGTAGDRDNFLTFLQELRASINSEVTSKDRLLVTVPVPSSRSVAEQGYHTREMHKFIDYFNLLSYDLHGPWEPKTGAHTALTSTDGVDIQAIVAFWLEQGAPREKLLLGFATHARGWTLDTVSDHSIGAAASGPSRAAQYTAEPGLLAYYEVLERQRTGFSTRIDNVTETAYTYYGDQWFSHDSPYTYRLKAEFLVSQGLAGAMVWSIDQDAFVDGSPLTQALRDAMPVAPSSPPSEDDGEVLNLTEIILIAIAGVLALVVLVVVLASCNRHSLASKPTFDNSGVGAEYDTPVPVVPVLKLSDEDLESETTVDSMGQAVRRLKPRYYDLGEMDESRDPIEKADEYVTTADGVLVDDNNRMVARFHDGEYDDIYDNDRQRTDTLRSKRGDQAELVAMRDGRYVARHYDDDDDIHV